MKNLLKGSKWRLTFLVLPYIILIVLAKFFAHEFGFEFLTLNSLFTAVISANIFLIGFLISGTLTDFKESERLPGEISSSIQSLFDEAYITYKNKNSEEAKNFMKELVILNELILEWFHKRVRTEQIYQEIFVLNERLLDFEKVTQANFIVRMKNEQSNLRKVISRIDTIRDTSFLSTGYAVCEIITFILVLGLIFVKIDPFIESIFFVPFVSFIMIYMLTFVKSLDNPFSYYEEGGLVEDVSLKTLNDTKKRIESYNINNEK